MVDVNDDAKGKYRRIEVLTGPGRRRRWSAEETGRIVAETLEQGARVSEVARCWQVCPQQMFGWRREARQDTVAKASKPRTGQTGDFVPILSEAQPPATLTRKATAAAPVIEVKLAGAVVRVSGPGDGAELTAVLRAIRASALDA
jgi:transposase